MHVCCLTWIPIRLLLVWKLQSRHSCSFCTAFSTSSFISRNIHFLVGMCLLGAEHFVTSDVGMLVSRFSLGGLIGDILAICRLMAEALSTRGDNVLIWFTLHDRIGEWSFFPPTPRPSVAVKADWSSEMVPLLGYCYVLLSVSLSEQSGFVRHPASLSLLRQAR